MVKNRIYSIKSIICMVAAVAILPGLAVAKTKHPKVNDNPRIILERPDPAYPPQPAFFELRQGDAVVYLLGSQHKIKKHTKWLTPRVRDAFFASSDIWFEITAEDSAHPIMAIKSMRSGAAEDGKSLANVLTPEEYARVEKVAQKLSIEMGNLDNLKPWLVADILQGNFQAKADKGEIEKAPVISSDAPVENTDLPAVVPAPDAKEDAPAPKKKPRIHMQGGVEDILSLMVIDRPTHSIENVEKHILLFDNLPDETQRLYLTNTLDELDDKSGEMEAMSKAWQSGDLPALGKNEVAKMKASNDSFYNAMLKSRNIEMADAIERELQKGSGTDFFVVGAAHLAGPDSVLQTLINRGYRPTRLYDTQEPVETNDPGTQPDLPLYQVAVEALPKLDLHLLAPTAEKRDVANLRIMATYVTNGCGEYLPIVYKTRTDGNILEIDVAGGTLFVNPPQKQDTCGPVSKSPYVDIPLKLADLRNNNIDTVWLMRRGSLDKLTVDLTRNDLTLTPTKPMHGFKAKSSSVLTVALPGNLMLEAAGEKDTATQH